MILARGAMMLRMRGMFLIDPHMVQPARTCNPSASHSLLNGPVAWLCFLLVAAALSSAQSLSAPEARSGVRTFTRHTVTGRFVSGRGRPTDRRLQEPSSTVSMPLLTARNSSASSTWSALGPGSVLSSGYGLVAGRISSIALDPSDITGNHLYAGTTGGGVWMAQNAAAAPSQIVFEPLTDSLTALGGTWDASISIGAVSVQPGATGVILAGTGDPNDALDSYYGAGILRSADGGSTWSLISQSNDFASGFST